jgi:hypothetical protein
VALATKVFHARCSRRLDFGVGNDQAEIDKLEKKVDQALIDPFSTTGAALFATASPSGLG